MQSLFHTVTDPHNQKIFFCAEMSGNHNNSLKEAVKFVHQAKSNGADCIKFQIFEPSAMAPASSNAFFSVESNTESWNAHRSLFELYSIAQTPWDWISRLVEECHRLKFPWFASVFDNESLGFAEDLGCPAYKIASPEITDSLLIESVLNTGKPLFVSTGVATETDINTVAKLVDSKEHGGFMLMHCTSQYPCSPENLHLSRIPTIRALFDCPVGFSDHSLGLEAPGYAAALGATFIEKHCKLDYDNSSVDHHFSMPLSQIQELRKKLNFVESACGSAEIKVVETESLKVKRSLFALTDIKRGDFFSTQNITTYRSNAGISPNFFPAIQGLKSVREISAGTPILVTDLTVPPLET